MDIRCTLQTLAFYSMDKRNFQDMTVRSFHLVHLGSMYQVDILLDKAPSHLSHICILLHRLPTKMKVHFQHSIFLRDTTNNQIMLLTVCLDRMYLSGMVSETKSSFRNNILLDIEVVISSQL